MSLTLARWHEGPCQTGNVSDSGNLSHNSSVRCCGTTGHVVRELILQKVHCLALEYESYIGNFLIRPQCA